MQCGARRDVRMWMARLPCWDRALLVVIFFFFNDTATTEIYTLSLHDALPILPSAGARRPDRSRPPPPRPSFEDRKSTRLNSSHDQISYAVFCSKKKN